VAKLLYLSRRSRQDIQTAVAFLCMRVQSLDTDDYKKLARVMKYIRGTKDITLTIEANDRPKWWVDSSYAVHPDMRSHSGIFMTLGKDTAYTASSKQKLNTKSSTEAELWLLMTLWHRYYGQDIFWQRKANTYLQQQYTKTTRVQYYRLRMGKLQLASEQNI